MHLLTPLFRLLLPRNSRCQNCIQGIRDFLDLRFSGVKWEFEGVRDGFFLALVCLEGVSWTQPEKNRILPWFCFHPARHGYLPMKNRLRTALAQVIGGQYVPAQTPRTWRGRHGEGVSSCGELVWGSGICVWLRAVRLGWCPAKLLCSQKWEFFPLFLIFGPQSAVLRANSWS